MHEFQTLPFLISEKGIELASSQARFEYYDSLSKVLLSSLMGNFTWSEASKKREAEATEEYKNHLLLVYTYREEMLTHKAQLQGLEGEFDYQRSMNATKRSEMRM